MAWYADEFFSPGPRPVKGGIRAHSKRGAFGESWWARRWSEVLEGFGIGGRLGRGRSYARRGQVMDISIEPGRVTARVQGSRPDPYVVSLLVRAVTGVEQERLAEILGSQALFAARLLAGHMPEDVETAFDQARLTLFPSRRADLVTECSCPDWSNPCKHVAAVYYLLGEEFDRDPFLIFRLRGIDREELLSRVAHVARRSRPATAGSASGRQLQAPAPADPLPGDPQAFWSRGKAADDPFGAVQVPADPAAQLKRLGRFPFWRGQEPLVAALLPLYSRAAHRGLEVFAGAHQGEERP